MDKLRSNRGRYKGADIFTDKRCEGKCGQVLDKSEFYSNRKNFDGLSDVCKVCADKASTTWRQANPEKKRANSARSYRKDPKASLARGAKRRAAKMHRTPSWSETEAIKEFYAKCPRGYHVDHKLPLQGELVSGLHVIKNLRYLPAAENLSKGNRFG